MRALRLTLFLTAAMVLAACGSPPSNGTGGGQGGGTGGASGACGPDTCAGCCLNGQCITPPNNGLNAVCGGKGAACVDCTVTGQFCGAMLTCVGTVTGGGAGGGTGGAMGGGTGGGATGGGATGGGATGGGATGGGATGGGTGGGSGCVDLCSLGVSICDTGGVRTCIRDTGSGCTVFGVANTCGAQTCSGGVCQASCVDQCTLNATQCASSGAPVKCQTLASGCTDWVLQASCGAGTACSGGTCVTTSSCTNQCTVGQTRCTSGGQQQTCVTLGSGCTDWSLPVACTGGQTCAAPATACGVAKCAAGAKRCSASTPAVETCDANGNWYTTSLCPQACSNGACTAAAACSAGTVRCNGANIEICNASGTAWLYNQTCPVSCSAGVCTGPCTAGATRCNGNVPEACTSTGSGWDAGVSCLYECYKGACTQNDLVIDGTTQTLEGDLKYSNSVTVRNLGQLKVGPTGILKLRAKTITLDSNTNINANDLGTDTRGQGSTSGSSCCSYLSGSTCYCTVTGGSGSGSSYGTSGASYSGTSASAYCSWWGGTRSCTLSSQSAGSIYDRDDDLSISMGSQWTSSNKGGGLVQLIADTVTVNGQITSNSTGAGASGGGVLIAANQISGTGVIQASGAGASPTGGNGRVKLLRGTTNQFFSGTIAGNSRTSPMPPLDLVSGSHPEQTKWYNDGLGDWFLAWSKPFPSLVGYYWKLSTSASTLPSSAAGNGTLIQAETIQVPAAQLGQGANYVHIVSVDSAFNVGTVKATQVVLVNTLAPTIASPSHPTQKSWGGTPAIALNWTNPQADSNFSGYYFVLDHYADTVPVVNPNNFTSNKQVILSNTPDGIWAFHLVNADTRGAITKAAAHYIVYIGANPGSGNVSGSVFDGSNNNAPMANVALSINHGLFMTTTAANGTYTFSNTLPAGTWEITASKAGYKPVTQSVTVAASGSVNQNFTLTP